MRFASERQQVEYQQYHLEVLLRLEHSRRVSPFVGIVRSDDTGAVSGFLCELPACGALRDVVRRASKAGQPISWHRRLKWCRQIVEGVVELHKKDVVAGTLCAYPHCAVAIDGHDNVVFFNRFQRFTSYNAGDVGQQPPECWELVPEGCSTPVKPQDELYHLGLLLWRVYANLSMGQAKVKLYEQLAGGKTWTSAYQGRQEEEIKLPPLDEQAPKYLRDVINVCRAESPEKRLRAKDLLAMFPPTTEASDNSATGPYLCDMSCSSHEGRARSELCPTRSTEEEAGIYPPTCRLARLEDVYKQIPFAIDCTACGGCADERAFRCEVCDSGDFDLCFPCFQKGLHCFDLSHQLREFSVTDDKNDIYYTSPKSDGLRDVIRL